MVDKNAKPFQGEKERFSRKRAKTTGYLGRVQLNPYTYTIHKN